MRYPLREVRVATGVTLISVGVNMHEEPSGKGGTTIREDQRNENGNYNMTGERRQKGDQ